MGVKSKLTVDQWDQIKRRYLVGGESARALSREFGVSEAAIRKRFGTQGAQVRTIAERLANIQTEIAALPVLQQSAVVSLADKLRNISNNLASAAEYGAATAHRLQAIAHAQVQKIDDADPMKSQEQLQAIAALTRIGNDSAKLGADLLTANKGDTEKPLDAPEMKPTTIKIVSKK